MLLERSRGAGDQPGAGHGTFVSEVLRELPVLSARAGSLARDRLLADDLVQDTVERALRHAATFAPGSNLRAWLMRIMLNLFTSECRVRRRFVDRDPSDELPGPDGEPRTLEPWEILGFEDVVAASALLDDHLRIPFELVVVQGLTYQQAADRLGLPMRTVGTRLFRARSRLRRTLGERLAAGQSRLGPS